jgi:hypothetical protein
MAINANLLLDETSASAELLSWSRFLWPPTQNHIITASFVDGMMHQSLNRIFNEELLLNHAYTYAEVYATVMQNRNLCEGLTYKKAIQSFGWLGLKTQTYSGDMALNSWVEDTQFTDIAILSSDRLQSASAETTNKIYHIIEDASCPLLILPQHPTLFKNIILTYDGSIRSAETIKKFCLLMGSQLKENRVFLLTIIKANTIPQEKQIIDYLKNHQPFFSLIRLYPQDDLKEVFDFMKDTEDFLWVSGLQKNELVKHLKCNAHFLFHQHGQRALFIG